MVFLIQSVNQQWRAGRSLARWQILIKLIDSGLCWKCVWRGMGRNVCWNICSATTSSKSNKKWTGKRDLKKPAHCMSETSESLSKLLLLDFSTLSSRRLLWTQQEFKTKRNWRDDLKDLNPVTRNDKWHF